MNRLTVDGEGTGIYIIDENYRIIYLNESAKAVYPDLRPKMTCYQGIFHRSSPCASCPGLKGDCSHEMFYNGARRQWVEMSSAEIDWPGCGRCRMLLFTVVDEQKKSLFYDLTGTSAYDELFELDLAKNTYKILFHQEGKYIIPAMEGQLDTMCMDVADHMIHPDDRERFLEFWNLDTLGERLGGRTHTLKGEFRKRLVNGGYCWVAQSAVLLRTGDNDSTVIMVFIQDIDEQKRQEAAAVYGGRSEQEERDFKTGLYRYGAFFEKAERLLCGSPDTVFCMIAIDIEHFKLFNEWFGEEAGDRFLVNIADQLRRVEEECSCVAGYMGGDDFAIVIPKEAAVLGPLERGIRDFVKQFGESAGFLPAFGIYEIEDRGLSASMMYDRASIALATVKGNYLNRTGWYDAGMKKKLEDDQVLLSEIQHGLDNHEFVFYVQPQCNMMTGRIVGLESLVRWVHPVRGVVPPGEFIPLLESNGFITNLDLYVWEEVCACLHDWIRTGNRPVPISVNVSRIDIYSMNVTRKMIELTDRYGIDPSLLQIEITESAYAENYDLIRVVVNDLRKSGFTVFMDDFGSGYSSLNMLKDVNVDVIKIDTKFLEMNENSERRGMGILETIIRMARLMQLRVIAEGVEKKEQVDFLRNVGCIYGQGYYYYRPMPVEQLKPLLLEENRVDYRGIQARQMGVLHLEDLVNEDVTSETILNKMLGGMALYDVCGGHVELLRVNEEYYRVTGCNPVDLEERRQFIMLQIHEEDKKAVLEIFDRAYRNPFGGAEGTVRRYRLSGELMWFHLRIFFLRERDDHRIYYGSVSDVTKEMEREEKLTASKKMLAEVLNMSGADGSFEQLKKEDRRVAGSIFERMAPGGLIGGYCEEGYPIYFANASMVRLAGYDTYEEFVKGIGGMVVNLIHPEDRERVRQEFLPAFQAGYEYSITYRLMRKDGSWLWVEDRGRVVQTEEGRLAVLSACLDISDTIGIRQKLEKANEILQFKNEELEFLSSGVPGGYHRLSWTEDMTLIYTSRRFLDILGYTRAELKELYDDQMIRLIHPDDRAWALPLIMGGGDEKEACLAEFRMRAKKGYIWIRYQAKRKLGKDGGSLYGVILDIDEIVGLRQELQEYRRRLDGLKRRGQAETDTLTGLYTKKAALPLMKDWISKFRGQQSALVLFRFNGMEAVNEAVGPVSGGRVFVDRVEMLKGFFRDEDIVCRLNGDEILVLCKNIRASDIRRKLERLLEDMKSEFLTSTIRISLSLSAGYAMIENDGADFQELYRITREALKRAETADSGLCLGRKQDER